MPDQLPQHQDLDLVARIDELCDSFEAHLKAGQQPNIDDILNAHPEPFRSLLACELRKVEQDYCRRHEQAEPAHRFNGYIHHSGSSATTEYLQPCGPGDQDVDVPFPQIPGFEILRILGKGGMGIVYLARDLQLPGRLVAIKMMLRGKFASRVERQRFYFEAEAVAALNHDNIVTIYAVGEYDGQPFLVLEYLEGGSLESRLKENCRYKPNEAATLVAELARAAQHAHDQGVLHRDLKPGNILLDGEKRPHLADFGLAHLLEGEHSLGLTGAILGTPPYMAPEQARGEKGLTVRVDVCALGAILYELLTGVPPFKAATDLETLELVRTTDPVPPRQLNSAVPKDLEKICLKCLRKDPERRYASARELALQLHRFLDGVPITDRQPGFWDWILQTIRNRPEPSTRASWAPMVWWGVLIFLQHGAVALLVAMGQLVGPVWVVLLAGWMGMSLVVWNRVRRFRQVAVSDRHSIVMAIGLLFAQVVLALTLIPLNPDAQGQAVLAYYPPLAVVSGLAYISLVSTHWGRLLPVGLATMFLALVMAHWPESGPGVYAVVGSGVMIWWGLAKWWYFRGQPAVSA
jgi:serine/threonine-protein kinase